jgi:tetratricopeptide (TPR) repeat protein
LAHIPQISLCMIVRNEEQHLETCLSAARSWVDQIVIVDTGSNDRTVEIARSFAAQVFEFNWCNDFSAARNYSIEQAWGEWILVLDADEVLDEPSTQLLRPLVLNPDGDGMLVTQRNFQPAGSLVSYIDLQITRLFRNQPAYRYQGAIHEQIQPAILSSGGKLAQSPLVVLHSGYAQKSAQGGQSRANRNLEILLNALAQHPEDAYLTYQAGVTYKALGNTRQAEEWLRKAARMDCSELGAQAVSDLYMKLAQLALGRNEHIAAVRTARTSLEYDPANTIARYVLALSSFYLGEIQPAYQAFSQLCQDPHLDPGSLGEIQQVMRFCQATLTNKNRRQK